MEQQKPKDIKQAAALRYQPEDDAAPVVVAVGHGKIAENIVERAEQHDIPIVEDISLANMLAQLSVGDQIPKELYNVVAQILIFISRMDEGYMDKSGISDAMNRLNRT